MHSGSVVEEGSHEQLMARPDSQYRLLVNAAEGRGASITA